MSEFDSGDSDKCQNLNHFLENNLITNLIRKTTVNTGPFKWKLLTLDEGKSNIEYYYSQPPPNPPIKP